MKIINTYPFEEIEYNKEISNTPILQLNDQARFDIFEKLHFQYQYTKSLVKLKNEKYITQNDTILLANRRLSKWAFGISACVFLYNITYNFYLEKKTFEKPGVNKVLIVHDTIHITDKVRLDSASMR